MTKHDLGSREWLDQVREEIIDPEREIVDPHHHLWRRRRWFPYLLEDLWTDTGSGHNVKKTVFVQCRSGYRTEGPEHLRPVGETEFVAEIAEQSRQGAENQARIAGIVSHADLTLGDLVEEILDAHEEAGRGLFRGIRHAGYRIRLASACVAADLGRVRPGAKKILSSDHRVFRPPALHVREQFPGGPAVNFLSGALERLQKNSGRLLGR